MRSAFVLKKSQVVVFSHSESEAVVTSGHANLSSRDEMLFVCARRCLKASEALKNEAISVKPVRIRFLLYTVLNIYIYVYIHTQIDKS